MTDHPITPPHKLVDQWSDMLASHSEDAVFSVAAQWGADQELDACCEWMADETPTNYINALRAARRPKPLSLKEQWLEEADTNLHDLLIEHDELLAKLSDVLRNIGLNKPAREADAAVERLHNFLAQSESALTVEDRRAYANPRDLIRRLTEKLDHLHCQYNVPNQSALIAEASAYLAQSESALTVEDCSNMRKHRFNFLEEDRFGKIVLD